MSRSAPMTECRRRDLCRANFRNHSYEVCPMVRRVGADEMNTPCLEYDDVLTLSDMQRRRLLVW